MRHLCNNQAIGLGYCPMMMQRHTNLPPRSRVPKVLDKLGSANPRRFLPTTLGGYTREQMEEPQHELQGGPLTHLGRFNPRRYLPTAVGGYTATQMEESQNKIEGGILTNLGHLNPRQYIPQKLGGYTEEQLQEPQNRVQGGPLSLLGPLNPRKHLPMKLGGYSPDQMKETQNYPPAGPLSLLGKSNPRRHLPQALGGYSEQQMLENYQPPVNPKSYTTRNPLKRLPKADWYRLFLDKNKHQEAEALSDPGMFFDNDRSPGYKRSMVEAMENAIIKDRGKRLNYDQYKEYHDQVIKYTDSHQHSNMLKLGGRDEWSQFSTERYPKGQEPEYTERLDAAAEMRAERVNGRPLITDFDESLLGSGNGLLSHPNAVSVRAPMSSENGDNERYDTRYASSESRDLVNGIFKDHYEGIDSTDDPQVKLNRIAQTVRSLHVGHFFGDANGRLNIMLLMNKMLVDEGFKPSVLPDGPSIFGGQKTIAGLVDNMERGMDEFEQHATL